MPNMNLTLVSIDTNDAVRLFPRRNFDPKNLEKTLRSHRLHLSFTEDSLAEVLGVEPEAAYQRLCRIAAFAELAGPEWFSVGHSLRAIIDHELEFTDEPSGAKFPRYSAEHQKDWLEWHVGSRDAFEQWHKNKLAETRRWFDPEGWLAKDLAIRVRGLPYKEFEKRFPKIANIASRETYEYITKRLATPNSAQDYLKEQIAKIPQELATNWALEKLVEDDTQRARVAREPERCPTLVALAGAYSLNRCGALVGVERQWERYGRLAPALNNYTDARIIAQAAYAHILVSNDKGLRRRAGCLRELKLFRPEAVRWSELLARHPS